LVHQIEVDAYLRDMEAEAEAFQRNYQANNLPTQLSGEQSAEGYEGNTVGTLGCKTRYE